MDRLVDQLEADYNRTGTTPKNAQAVVRRHHGKVKALHRELSQELHAIGYCGRYATAGEVLDLMTEAHDRALDAARPSARAILRQQVGEHWHDIAKRLRSEGATYGAIAKAIGQGRSAVSNYLLRNA
ncbi:hypothetical protein [Pseudomonas sp. GZD-222]|uniref:hypothetical protein n=1 Tax=Pseudomonas sp. GZD-222 TaxID=3404805 RepID=UPI003BB531EA